MLMLDGMPAVRVKAEPLESEHGSPKVHSYPTMDTVPLLLSKVKPEPPEDLLSHDPHFQTQTEPVDLSINKPRPSPPSFTSTASPVTSAFSPPSISSSSLSFSSLSVITSASSVLTPGPLVAPGAAVRGHHHHHQQQFLHIMHPVPPPPSSPLNLGGVQGGGGVGGKMGGHQVHRIPVVVQSLPLMHTTSVRSPSSLHNNAIMLPLLDDHKSHHGKARTDHNGLLPRHIKSDSEDDDLPNVTLDSVNETGSTALSIARAVQKTMIQHTSRLCKGYLTKKESDGVLHQMTWPPQSPNLNPDEMDWDELDHRVKEKQPTSVHHMWEVLQECWKSIPVPCHHSVLRAYAAPGGQSRPTPRRDASTGVTLRAAIRSTPRAPI
uniref:Kruppel like factor 12b n=1 Tax=Oncorhynchus tshawytscha TaxID=74940 RepID=A0A8C8K3U9_ONCTS